MGLLLIGLGAFGDLETGTGGMNFLTEDARRLPLFGRILSTLDDLEAGRSALARLMLLGVSSFSPAILLVARLCRLCLVGVAATRLTN